MGHLLTHCGRLHLDDIKSAALSDFEQRRKADGVSSSSIRRDLACLSVIFSTAEEWEWVSSNPVKPFLRSRAKKGLREGAPHTRWLSHAEEEAILAAIPFKAGQAVIFAIDTGLRKEEQFSLLWADVDLRAKEIQVRADVSKTSKSRVVPLLDRTWRQLRDMPRHLHCPYVFHTQDGKRYSPNSPTCWEGLQKAVRRAGIAEKVQWHDLRRTCGCRLLQDRGFSMEVVAKWLGHSSVKVTERHYAFLTEAELHKAVARSEAQIAQISGQR
jgi:integrase/recombinase XerD